MDRIRGKIVSDKTYFIAYYRVSTDRQGATGLGIEAQREAVQAYAKTIPNAEVIEHFTEVESGKSNDRPELAKAIYECELTGHTLLIAKLDRLSRDSRFLANLLADDLNFVCCDMPKADKVMVGIMSYIAEWEREQIGRRTKSALAALKKRYEEAEEGSEHYGKRLGNPNGAEPLIRSGKGNTGAVAAIKQNADDFAAHKIKLIDSIKENGITTYKGIARELNRRKIRTPRNGVWHPSSVSKLMKRIQRVSGPIQARC